MNDRPTSSTTRILVVEDEPRLAAVLLDYLRTAGFDGTWIADGHAVIPAVRAQAPDLILLDLMLPGRDGLDLCRELRSFSQLPIIIVTARVEELDRLLGLELGADDYICKPFSPREVVARVRVILRRIQRTASSPPPADEGPLQIDAGNYRASYQGQMLELTPVEFRLLRTLSAAPGRVFSRAQLMDQLYTDHRIVTDRTVDSHIKNLRRKLVQTGAADELIRSVYGVGYSYEG